MSAPLTDDDRLHAALHHSGIGAYELLARERGEKITCPSSSPGYSGTHDGERWQTWAQGPGIEVKVGGTYEAPERAGVVRWTEVQAAWDERITPALMAALQRAADLRGEFLRSPDAAVHYPAGRHGLQGAELEAAR